MHDPQATRDRGPTSAHVDGRTVHEKQRAGDGGGPGADFFLNGLGSVTSGILELGSLGRRGIELLDSNAVSGHRGSRRSDSRSVTFPMDPFLLLPLLGIPEHGPGSLNLGELGSPLQCGCREREKPRERSDGVDIGGKNEHWRPEPGAVSLTAGRSSPTCSSATEVSGAGIQRTKRIAQLLMPSTAVAGNYTVSEKAHLGPAIRNTPFLSDTDLLRSHLK